MDGGIPSLPQPERLALSLKLLVVDLPTDAGELIIRRWENAFLLEPPSFNNGSEEIVKELFRRLRLGIISDTGMTPGSVIRRFLAERGLLDLFSETYSQTRSVTVSRTVGPSVRL